MANEKKKPRERPKEETPFERFERLTKKILAVPKEAIKEPKKDKPQPSR
jgi:hypothetical protein